MARKLSTKYTLTCEWCGKPFYASRQNTRFCGVNHRNAFHRHLAKLAYEKSRAIDAFKILLRNAGDPKFRGAAISEMMDVEQYVSNEVRRLLVGVVNHDA